MAASSVTASHSFIFHFVTESLFILHPPWWGSFPLLSTLLQQSCWSLPLGFHSSFPHPSFSLQRRLSQVPTCFTMSLLLKGKAPPFQVNCMTLLSQQLPKPPQSSRLYMDVTLFWAQPPFPLFAIQMAIDPCRASSVPPAGNQAWCMNEFINTRLALWLKVNIFLVTIPEGLCPHRCCCEPSAYWLSSIPSSAKNVCCVSQDGLLMLPCLVSLEAILPSPVSHLDSPRHRANLGGQFEQEHSTHNFTPLKWTPSFPSTSAAGGPK